MSDRRKYDIVDAGAIWDGLPPEIQRRFGMAAIVTGLAYAGVGQMKDEEAKPFDIALWEVLKIIHEDVQEHVLHHLAQPDLPRPDLSCFGIEACRVCGCTENCACAEGCGWAEPGLCTSCAPNQ